MATNEPPVPPIVSDLVRSVSLLAVRLTRSSSEFGGIKREDVLKQLLLRVNTGGARSPDAPQVVRALVGVEATLKPEGQDRIVAKVTCDLALDYAVRDKDLFDRLTDKDCETFAETNGVYNAWPYVREFIQSISVRMLLPSLILLPTLPPAMLGMQPIEHPPNGSKSAPGQER